MAIEKRDMTLYVQREADGNSQNYVIYNFFIFFEKYELIFSYHPEDA